MPGNRRRDTGTLYDVGNLGFSWSSSVTDSNARYLDFGNTRVTPQYSYYRVYGFPVRCLQE